jgi:dihydrofolate reductase
LFIFVRNFNTLSIFFSTEMQTSTIYPFEKDIPDIRDLGSVHPYSTYNSNISRLRPVYAIVAMARDLSIGVNGDMPWHISADLRRFKTLTMGHPVIMGRNTWESLPKRPLPGRKNIVITRQPDYQAEGAVVVATPEDAIAACEADEIPFVIGGGSIYRQLIPFIEKLFVTLVDASFPEADTFFPALPEADWKVSDTEGPFETDKGLKYSFMTLTRR